ncbi:MAG: DUF58 domain-containing protein [Bowdeniella nasicola]|nr:DUF58 domain-containing protein [Bowdeniella nasicola]
MVPSLRFVLLLAIGIIPLAIAPRPATVAQWTLLCLVVALVDWSLAGKPQKALIARDITPTAVRLGQDAISTLTVYNPTTSPLRLRLRDVWPPTAAASPEIGELTIPAGERRRMRTTLTPLRAGTRTNHTLALRSYGPLRLLARTRVRDVPGELQVLPPFTSRRHLPSRLARLREMDGRSSVNVRGQGTEFDSLREYVSGDDVRAIDWRATARAQDLMVRTWRPERDRRVVIIVDTGRLAAARLDLHTRLDAHIDATLLLAALTSHAGDRVDVVALDTAVHVHVSQHSGPTLMHELAVALADVEAQLRETNWKLAATTVHRLVSQRSLVVILTALDPAVISGGLRDVAAQLATQHTVVIAGAGDKELTELATDRTSAVAAYTAAAAEQTLADQRTAISALNSAGAHVVYGSESELPVRLADSYLQLKASAQL